MPDKSVSLTAGFLIGVYLLAVVAKGEKNVDGFIGFLKRQSGFVKWIIAILLIGYISKLGKIEPIGRGFLLLALVAMMLKVSGDDGLKNLANEMNKIFEVTK